MSNCQTVKQNIFNRYKLIVRYLYIKKEIKTFMYIHKKYFIIYPILFSYILRSFSLEADDANVWKFRKHEQSSNRTKRQISHRVANAFAYYGNRDSVEQDDKIWRVYSRLLDVMNAI